LKKAIKNNTAYAEPRGHDFPPAGELTTAKDDDDAGLGKTPVGEITRKFVAMRFHVSSNVSQQSYEFITMTSWRGLLIPMKLAPLTAIPDKRFATYTWYKLPHEIRGENNVRTAAKRIIEAFEQIRQQGTGERLKIPKKENRTDMLAFGIGSFVQSGKRYKFLTAKGCEGLWARCKTFNRDDLYQPDPDYPLFFKIDNEVKGNQSVRALARKMVQQHEGIKTDPEIPGNPLLRRMPEPTDTKGAGLNIYLPGEYVNYLAVIQQHLASLDSQLGNRSKGIQIALKYLAGKIKRNGKIDWEDA
jgi:hypothetical protein